MLVCVTVCELKIFLDAYVKHRKIFLCVCVCARACVCMCVWDVCLGSNTRGYI